MPVSASITCSKMRLREHHPINEVDFFPFCMAVCVCQVFAHCEFFFPEYIFLSAWHFIIGRSAKSGISQCIPFLEHL